MTARPGIHLTLCGFTDTADRLKLFPDTATKSKELEFKLTEKHKIGLGNLTSSRYTSIKAKFIAKKIDPARLIACEPEHEEKRESSGVEISI